MPAHEGAGLSHEPSISLGDNAHGAILATNKICLKIATDPSATHNMIRN